MSTILTAQACYSVFQQSIDDYHVRDHVDTPVSNPLPGWQL